MAKIKETVKIDPKIDLFNFDLKADKQQKIFAEIFNKYDGNWSAIKPELPSKDGFNDKIIGKLEFTHHLAEWSNDNAQLVSAFQQDGQFSSLRDIALNLDKAAFTAKVKPFAPTALTRIKRVLLGV